MRWRDSFPKRQCPGHSAPGIVEFVVTNLADDGDVRGAGALRAVRDLELDLVTLVEGAIAVGPDLRVVDEHVRTTLLRQETEALRLVEPLDGTLNHGTCRPPKPVPSAS